MNCPLVIRTILESLDDPRKLLSAVLEQALIQTRSIRGLIFDHEQILGAVGYNRLEEKMGARRALDPLRTECYGVVLSDEPFFGGTLRDCATWFSPGRWLGAAGVLTGPSGNLAVVAIEKESPITEDELAGFEDWLHLASKPVALAVSYERQARLRRREPLTLHDLPISDLADTPRMQEVQMWLIADAMRRNRNNKGKAAAALGISREGLRRKLLRESEGV